MAETLTEGDRVEVRRRLDAGWARGFVVASVSDTGMTVRRLSDNEVLPVEFDPEDVRRERRRNDFWWM